MKGGLSIVRRRGLSPHTTQPPVDDSLAALFNLRQPPEAMTLYTDTQFVGMNTEWVPAGWPSSWIVDEYHVPTGFINIPSDPAYAIMETDLNAPFPGNTYRQFMPGNWASNGTSVGKFKTYQAWAEFFPTVTPYWRSCYWKAIVKFEGYGGHYSFGTPGQDKFWYQSLGTLTHGHSSSVVLLFDSSIYSPYQDGGGAGFYVGHQNPGFPTTTYGHTGDAVMLTEQYALLEGYMRSSDVGQSNGIMAGWINGEESIYINDIDNTDINGGQTYILGCMFDATRNGVYPTAPDGQDRRWNRIALYFSNT